MKKDTKTYHISKPVRTCIGCLHKKGKYELIRFIRDTDGSIILDREQKCPGRGAYVCPDMNCLENALKKNQFDRVFRQKTLKESFQPLKSEFAECLKTRSAH